MNRLSRPCLECGRPTKGELGGGIVGYDGRPMRATGRGSSYCADHQPKRVRRQQYNHEWRKRSLAARKAQPWCSDCGATEDLTADHVIPLGRGGELIPEAGWIKVLCRSCNGRKGARIEGGGGQNV